MDRRKWDQNRAVQVLIIDSIIATEDNQTEGIRKRHCHPIFELLFYHLNPTWALIHAVLD